ncbi:hypothetical protein [Compostimonas suwonensis]|uniref:Ribbon-helix-helix CopG family protein n=1 Tax=Compostimonas suwonensis TaxID=1048394 RepID=A0A2M9BW76_9MICO|nr:hypothetical protein [Compostimonas suwonensis]PJJ62190.1 hypothetical protein CLV54_1987 [Compostimonas suwonensis]
MTAKPRTRRPPAFDADTRLVDVETHEVLYRGEPLNEARVEGIVEGLRARSAANLVPGGKSLSRNGSHSPLLQFRVPEGVREALSSIAEERQVSLSRVAREAVVEYLRNHESA